MYHEYRLGVDRQSKGRSAPVAIKESLLRDVLSHIVHQDTTVFRDQRTSMIKFQMLPLTELTSCFGGSQALGQSFKTPFGKRSKKGKFAGRTKRYPHRRDALISRSVAMAHATLSKRPLKKTFIFVNILYPSFLHCDHLL